MSRTSGEYPCPPPNQNIGQSCPIFFVSINHNGDIGAFTNVSYPFQQERGDLFGFLVNGGVEVRTINGIANGHNQWASPGIRSCQMGHSPSANEFLLLLDQNRASSQNGLTGSGLLGQFPNLLHACHQLFHRTEPAAANSSGDHPCPRPRRNLPPERTSIVLKRRANMTGL